MPELFSRICGNGKSAILFVSINVFPPPISDLIDLARWVKIKLIILSGTESNRGTKCVPRLARFNLRLALEQIMLI